MMIQLTLLVPVIGQSLIHRFVTIFLNVNGLLIDNITCTITDPTYNINFIDFGFGLDDSGVINNANNVILQNSTFTNRNATAGFDGLFFIAGNNITLDNVAIDMNAVERSEIGAPFNASLHIGDQVLNNNPNRIVTGAKINKVLINNTPNIGITIERDVRASLLIIPLLLELKKPIF